jgi:hypothetical protein
LFERIEKFLAKVKHSGIKVVLLGKLQMRRSQEKEEE